MLGRDKSGFGGGSDVDLEFVGRERRRLDASGNTGGSDGDGSGLNTKTTVRDGGGDSDRWSGRVPKGAEVFDEFGLLNAQLVVEQVEQLLLHEVDLGEGEEPSVLLPVHVLGRRIIEVLCCADEDGEEDSVTCAGKPYPYVS